MPIRPCSECHTDNPRFLEGASLDAMVNFYRCDKCGHVWSVLKSKPDGPIWGVTLPPKK